MREALIAEYMEMRHELLRFLTARLGNAAAAEDAYQDMFLKIRSAHLPDDIGQPRAFLYKTASNLAGDIRRGSKRRDKRDGEWLDSVTHRVGGETVVDQADPVSAIDSRQRLNALVAAANTLTAKCRDVFVLHKLEGLSHAQVATRVGISVKTVEKHMATALKSLSTMMRRGESDR